MPVLVPLQDSRANDNLSRVLCGGSGVVFVTGSSTCICLLHPLEILIVKAEHLLLSLLFLFLLDFNVVLRRWEQIE